MQRPTRDLKNLAIGNVKHLNCDDEAWAILHLVGETGSRRPCRTLLITRQQQADYLDCDS